MDLGPSLLALGWCCPARLPVRCGPAPVRVTTPRARIFYRQERAGCTGDQFLEC